MNLREENIALVEDKERRDSQRVGDSVGFYFLMIFVFWS